MSELANTVAHTRAYINHGQCRVAAFVKRSKRASRSAGLAGAPPRAHGLARAWTPGSPRIENCIRALHVGHRDVSSHLSKVITIFNSLKRACRTSHLRYFAYANKDDAQAARGSVSRRLARLLFISR